MDDLISRAAAILELQKSRTRLPSSFLNGLERARMIVSKLPSVDAAPVVRCRDCKHCYFAANRVPAEQCLVCDKYDIDVTDDFYCADGERRDGE